MENGRFALLSSPLGAYGQRTMFMVGSLDSYERISTENRWFRSNWSASELHNPWPDPWVWLGRVGSENLEGCAGRVGSSQDGRGTQIWRHEIELVIKCCLVCISCHIWLLYIILLFSMYMHAGDRTVDETLSASASARNCRHNGTIVLIARCSHGLLYTRCYYLGLLGCSSCKCRPPLRCFTAGFGDRGHQPWPQFHDFISRVFDNSANALELSHNDCNSSTAVSVPSKLVPSHAVLSRL